MSNTSMFDWLPGIEYWGARRIDDTISKEAAGGALLGLLIANPLARLATVAASVGRHYAGPIGAHLAWWLGWSLTAYVALFIIANWRSLDNE